MRKTAHLMGGVCSGVVATEVLMNNTDFTDYKKVVTLVAITLTILVLGYDIKLFSILKKIIFGKGSVFKIGILLTTLIILCKYKLNINVFTWIILYISLISGTLLGSLLPDIDHPNSALGSKVPIISRCLNKVLGHRWATHSLVVNVPFYLILIFIVHKFSPTIIQLVITQFILGILFGVLSHLFLDSLTVSGIPLLYPISNRRFRLARLRTGEHDILGILLCIFICTYVILLK